MGRCHYVPLRRRHNIPIRRPEDVPLRRLGEVLLRHHWVFHLRRTCDLAGTYKETSLRRRHDVSLPGGLNAPFSKCPLILYTKCHNNNIIKLGRSKTTNFRVLMNYCPRMADLLFVHKKHPVLNKKVYKVKDDIQSGVFSVSKQIQGIIQDI